MTQTKWNVTLAALVSGFALSGLGGCGSSQPPTSAMAPPVQQAPMMQQGGPMGNAPMNNGMNGDMNGGMASAGGDVFNWRDVPQNQRVPVMRATFDQGGYQIFTDQGTIVVPFENQNLYVMRFGRTSGQPFFVTENGIPTLYLTPGGFLENAAAQGARWYPIPNDFQYSQPMYVGLAPSWGAYTSMGWYPGMAYYGGLWGYRPGVSFAWMPGFSVHIGSSIYPSYTSYTSYYTTRGGYVPNRVVYKNYNVASRGTGSFGTGRSGSYSRSSSSYSGGSNRTSGGTGSYNSGKRYGYSGGTGYGNGTRPGGTGSFGSGSTRGNSSFGSSSGRSYGGSSGMGSFGGSRGYSSSPRSGGGSFGGGSRSYGGGGSSFGGGSRSSGSSGGSFGRRR